MKNLVKVMFGGIIGASVLAGGVALAHGWAGEGYGWGHGGMYGSGCRNLQQVPEGYGRWGRRGHRFPGMFNHGFSGTNVRLLWDGMKCKRPAQRFLQN